MKNEPKVCGKFGVLNIQLERVDEWEAGRVEVVNRLASFITRKEGNVG